MSTCGDAHSVMDIIVRNEHGEPSSNLGQGCWHFI